MSLTLSPGMSRDSADPAQRVTFIALVVACLVITVLTAAAFWLSYAHLAEVAGGHGLGGSPIRQWAWPATLDLFIVAGEVLMFVDALRGRKGREAVGPIFLTVAGSLGSIGLNVAGVGLHAPKLDYVVAAVPPTAALLAFGALMRQVHHFIVSLPSVPAVPEDGDKGQDSVPAAVSHEPIVPVSRVPQDVPPVVSRDAVPAPTPVVPEPVPAAVSRPRAAVPAVSRPRPTVNVPVDTASEETGTERDTVSPAVVPALPPERDSQPAQVVFVPDAKAGVPEDMLGNLSSIVRFLLETGHSRDEVRSIVPTLPGHADVKPDSLRKAVLRAEKALANEG